MTKNQPNQPTKTPKNQPDNTIKSTKNQPEQPPKTTQKPEQPQLATSEPTSCPTTPTPWVYTDIVKEHFLNPRNFLMGDETKYPHDAEGLVGNPICGDQMKMFLQIDPATDIITDVKWKTYGCASAIASTSALSELAKNRTLDDALKIDAAQIADFLGGLPAHKFHCSVLGHEALQDAIANYRSAHPQASNKSEN